MTNRQLHIVITAGQYREAATDLQHAVSLLRAIYTTQLVPFQQQKQQQQQPVSWNIFGADLEAAARDDEVDNSGVVAAVGTLIDTVALLGDELAERTRIDRQRAPQTNLSNVSAVVVATPLQTLVYYSIYLQTLLYSTARITATS